MPNDPTLWNRYEYYVNTVHRRSAVEAALDRAVFLLKKEGNGAYDNQQAAILADLKFKEPT